MAAQKGKALLLKTGAGTPLVYTTAAGLRLTRLTLNAETVDVTTADSANAWRELLGGAGVKSAAISGQGVFKDAASDAFLKDAFFSGEAVPVQALVPDFGTLTGLFVVAQLEYAGEYKGEVSFSLSLASAGEIVFAAL
jgi:TP901-1 family phage major tail protein